MVWSPPTWLNWSIEYGSLTFALVAGEWEERVVAACSIGVLATTILFNVLLRNRLLGIAGQDIQWQMLADAADAADAIPVLFVVARTKKYWAIIINSLNVLLLATGLARIL